VTSWQQTWRPCVPSYDVTSRRRRTALMG